jgi:hypothetical protein
MFKADTIYSLHALQIARINEYLENFSAIIKSSSSVFLQVKLFIGVTFINTWHIYKDQCFFKWFLWKTDYGSTIPGFCVQINVFSPSLSLSLSVSLSLSLSLSISHLSLVQYAQLW